MSRIAQYLFPALVTVALALPAVAQPAKVDLNRATVAELVELPHIGPALAARVVQYRSDNGGFRTVEDLMSVRGIGKKTFELLRDRVTVGAPSEAGARAKAEGGPGAAGARAAAK